MSARLIVAVSVVALSLTSCAAREETAESDGTWVGTIATEGNVTTVVNESGSVWGGAARLVEEASFGVESGDEAYMLGRIAGIAATDEEIYVLDEQKPAVRVYDYHGRHLRDLGAGGEGPGEFQRPRWVAVTADGRVLVLSRGNNRVNVYGPGPDDVDSWPIVDMQCCIHPTVFSPEGTLWTEVGILNEAERSFDEAMQAHGPEGAIGEPLRVPEFDYERWTMHRNGREIEAVPYAPKIAWAIHPAGLMVAGSSDRYRFEVWSPEGLRTVVERYWDPFEIIDAEEQYSIGYVRQVYGRTEGGQGAHLEWDGRIPETKPAYHGFNPSHSGEIWVRREGPGEAIPGCDPTELAQSPYTGSMLPKRCFTAATIIDVFELDGRYLGTLDTGAASLHPTHTFIRGNTVISESQDDTGTIMVKRYRLVLPGEQ
jgi:hypothetical protein